MKFLQWNVLLILVATCIAGIASSNYPPPSGSAEMFDNTIGVSIAGAEFGVEHPAFSNENPGTFGRQYTFPGEATIVPLANQGVRLMRIPIRWERMQPQLGRKLNPRYLKQLDQSIKIVGANGGRVIIDLHNYGRYRLVRQGIATTFRIDEMAGESVAVSRADLADFWQRMAEHYRSNTSVMAYAIMNEPHDMQDSDWKAISQASVDSIRRVDSDTWIFVAGDDWSSAARFEQANGPIAWIKDPRGRTAYEAHCYFDHDASGQYALSFDEEQQADSDFDTRVNRRLQPFATWCKRNNVTGFVGEFGVPVDDQNWNRLLDQMLLSMQQHSLSGCVWSAGPWWDKYPLSVEMGDGQAASRSIQLIQQYN